MKWFLWIDEKQQGPFNLEQIQALLAQGRVRDVTLCVPEDGNGDWTPIKEGLSALLPKPGEDGPGQARSKHLHEVTGSSPPLDCTPKKVKRIPIKAEYVGGKESAMDGLGSFFLAAGFVGAFLSLVAAFDGGPPAVWIAVALGSLLQGIAMNILLGAGAEVIRLLKHANKLKFSGQISEAQPVQLYKCSECGTELGNLSFCYKCNVTAE